MNQSFGSHPNNSSTKNQKSTSRTAIQQQIKAIDLQFR